MRSKSQINPDKTPDKTIVDRTKRHSAASKVIREGRASAANAHLQPLAYEVERLRLYAENHVNARIAVPLFMLIVAIVAANWLGALVALYWGVVTILGYGLLHSVCSRFLKTSENDLNLSHWRKIFLAAQLIVAASWSVFAWYYCENCNISDTYGIIQFSAILVFQAMTMMLSYSLGASLLVTSAPATIVLASRFTWSGDAASLVMAAILICSQIFFYLIANRFRLSLISGLAHRAERENLIAELETAKAISEEARRRAEEANLAKSRFLATMSHELRTPLNAILGFSEVMQGEVLGPLGNETYKEYVNDINSSGAHLLNVINEILDLSRIEAGRQEMQEEALKLAHIVEDAKHMVDLKAKTKSVKMILNAEENMPLIWADEKAVRQIALNLLSNALKFTPSGGQITINIGWTSAGGQYFSIADTGPGIPEEEIPVVLSSFGQGSIAIKSAEAGSGLGLPIVQALMHMHEGKFELKSGLRKGTTVIATFPRSRVLEIMEKTDTRANPRRRPASGGIRSAS
jgi:two-component system cell cycle sensor histidine kinase PleC